MRFQELIQIADERYPDYCVGQAYKQGEKYFGDLLARFIVEELDGVCESEPTDARRLDEAIGRMDKAACELLDVVQGFKDARARLTRDLAAV